MTEIPVSKYMRIPWKDKGRDESGCDCYGMAKLVLEKEFDTRIPDILYDTSMGDVSDLIDLNKPTIGAVQVQSPEEGDIVLMNRGGHPAHMGIYLDGGYVLHTDRKMGTCCERIDGWRLRNTVEGYYRVRKNQSIDPPESVQG